MHRGLCCELTHLPLSECGLAFERLSATTPGVPARSNRLAEGCGNYPSNLLALFGRHENRIEAFRRGNGIGDRINGGRWVA
jgi:hypothetical protein